MKTKQILDNWKELEVENFASVITGGTPSTSKKEYWENGDIPWLPSGDLKNKSINSAHIFITPEGLKNSAAKIMPKKTVLIALTGATTGQTGFLEIEASANQSVTGILPSESHSPKYLYYYLQTIRKKIISKSYGGAQPHISQGFVKKIKVPIPFRDGKPDIKEQERIASILEKAEKVKEKGELSKKLLDEYLKSKFNEMFGNPVTNSKKWEVKSLKDISTKIMSGTTPKGGTQVYVEKGVTFFRSQNVWKNRLLLKDIAYIDDETHNRLIKSSLKYKDILMTKTGRINTENSSLGRAAIFLGEDNSANINGHVYLIRLEKGVIHKFVLFILTTKEYREYIRSVCVGGIDKRQINKEHLNNFPIIFPPLSLQEKFAKIFEHVEQMKENIRKTQKNSEELYLSLMEKAFRGEL